MSHRDYVRRVLAEVAQHLKAGLPLQPEHVRCLIEIGDRANAGHVDPLGYALPSHRQDDAARQALMARFVHDRIKKGVPPKDAYSEAGEHFHVTGGSDGAAAKASTSSGVGGRPVRS